MEKAAKHTYDDKTPFKTLLESACDFDLVNSVFVKIGDRYKHWVEATMTCRIGNAGFYPVS